MLSPLIAAVSLLFIPCLAVFADEAWSIDYHYALLGEPKEDTSFFHQPNPNSRASLIYTLSNKGVAGAINPRDGSVVWRQLLSNNGPTTHGSFFRAGEGQEMVFSGFGNHVAGWNAGDGRLIWDLDLDAPLEDVEVLELSDNGPGTGTKDVVVLSGGESPTVQRLDGSTGTVKWQHKIEGTDVPYQLSASTTKIFATFLHKTMLGYLKIRVLSLDPVDGSKTDEYTLSSEGELASADTIVSVGANSASPIIAWTDTAHSVLKVNIVGTKTISTLNIDKQDDSIVERIRIQAPYHANSLSHFLVHYETASAHWADIFHVDLKTGKVQKAYSLAKLGGKGAFCTSTSDANVYFTRITRDEIVTVSSTSHGVLGRWALKGFGVAAGPGEEVFPVHAKVELSVKGDTVSAIRTAVYLSTGDWILLREGSPVWQRPESLASILSATSVTPSKVEEFAHVLEEEAHSNPVQAYIHRIKRHLDDLKYLPSLFESLPQRFLSGFLGTDTDGGMASNAFGFHQIIACATKNGRLMALDAGNPSRILWNRQIDRTSSEKTWRPQLSSGERGTLLLGEPEQTRPRIFNATNGLPMPDVVENDQMKPRSRVQYTLENGELKATRLNTANSGASWHFIPMAGERIIGLVPRPVNEPVASIGKVLGDRRVLYKYLDPNLALLTTVQDATNTANFYVLDTVAGSVLYSSTHNNVDLRAPVSSIVSENWFAYSYTTEATETSTKGHQLVVGEMFESLVPNDRGPLNAATNFSSMRSESEPFTLVQSYQIPESISKMAVTQTQQGITSRQLLAVLPDSQAIIGIPYGVLDPRRPANRDPTKDEQAEGLVRYSPVIEFDPKWMLNHQREVLGIDNIITTPAVMESTSLVFAYGLDIFGTRLSPSFSFDILGKDFNKFQMLATVAALAVSTFVVAPLVMRKQVNTRWQFA